MANIVPVEKDPQLLDSIGYKSTKIEDAMYMNELTTLNLGPTHPATHGIFQNVLLMDGEKIVAGESTVGYIHRAFEKNRRAKTFLPDYYPYR